MEDTDRPDCSMSGMGTQKKCLFEGFRGGTCKFTWNGSEIPYIGDTCDMRWVFCKEERVMQHNIDKYFPQ